MEGLLQLALLILLYSSIWLVPTSINYKRRKVGLAPYWLLFLTTLTLEIAIIYAIFYAFKDLNKNIVFAYLPPIIASISAGVFYYYIAKQLDKKHK